MPSLEVESLGVQAVEIWKSFVIDLLSHAQAVKPATTIEPALNESSFEDLSGRIQRLFDGIIDSKTARWASIEAVAREIFINLIATTSIDSPDFVQVWNLLDILAILSNTEECDPALALWLVEELVDSQTIAGCRKVFDFLESRRERLVTTYFKQRHLVILRLCNELLRRLSRAEDTSFCGRVFIFMFQSFPLGNRSSVNLRGEYHVENVTHYDQSLPASNGAETMDVDTPASEAKTPADTRAITKSTLMDGKKQTQLSKSLPQPLPLEELYPVFWSLQAWFSQPRNLFEAEHFTKFKHALETTLAAFLTIQSDQGRPKNGEEGKRSLKRKFDEGDNDLATTFNPKYLTSRDLFALEINDLSFRRHVLVQALIIINFLLSLTKEAYAKVSVLENKNQAVWYHYQVSDADAEWLGGIKEKISAYLKLGSEGPYFFRMVETILSRDKHWSLWKVHNCPEISKKPISAEQYHEAMSSLQHKVTNKRIKSMGSLSLDFLGNGDAEDVLEKFKAPERYEVPELDAYKRKIADDDFEIEMPTNEQSKAAAIEGKRSKSWQALRLASRFKLQAFDKLENEDKLDVIFDELPMEDEEIQEEAAEPANLPEDLTLVVIVDPVFVRKSPITKLLLEKQPGAFKKVAIHTTRKPDQGEKNGEDFTFVDKQAFNMMRDGDQLYEFSETEAYALGTSIKAVEAVRESGKVPLLELDHSALQQARDMGLSGRFVFINPPGDEALSSLLKERGDSEEQMQALVKSMMEDAALAGAEGTYNLLIPGEDHEAASKALESFIYRPSPDVNGNGVDETATEA